MKGAGDVRVTPIGGCARQAMTAFPGLLQAQGPAAAESKLQALLSRNH